MHARRRPTAVDPRVCASSAPASQRLAALIPRPRLHLIGFRGVLAPHAKLRAALVPDVVQPASEPAHEHTHGQAPTMSWARLLKRAFDIDIERCAYGGKLKIIAAIEDTVVIVRILTHLGLPARVPPRPWRGSLRSCQQPNPKAQRRFCGRTGGLARLVDAPRAHPA